MKPSFLARPVRLFGSVAVVILCVIFFIVPFALRGSKLALERVENNIKDWLPSDFPETKELNWFGEHFVGESFVLVTWEGCTEEDPRFELLTKKLRAEVVSDSAENFLVGDPNDPIEQTKAIERLRARQMGDRLELATTGDYYEDWGGRGERWLLGAQGQWYFITPQGELVRWSGKSTVPGFVTRWIARVVTGRNQAQGQLEATLGEPSTAELTNEFFNDPRKLTARLFKTVSTGPETLAELSDYGGPLWPRGTELDDDEKAVEARKTALERLTGTLFAPAVPDDFLWRPEHLRSALSAEKLAEFPTDWEAKFRRFVSELIERDYAGDATLLRDASLTAQSGHWDTFFASIGVDPPARETAAIVTLSDAGDRDLARAIGRDILQRPLGKLLDLAINECGVPVADLRMGGPPVDNVAIDEEGMITLGRLIGWSAAIGLALSYLCFRSVKITIMVFFVGGVGAMTSLALVWWSGVFPFMQSLSAVDAVLLSMPSLVYVLGLSGAVHIVNYYREAVERDGVDGAPERALAHGWGPCTLAAFTTALGLISLFASNLLPIKKFGLFSALGVMATLFFLFVYLPCALTIFAPGYYKQRRDDGSESLGLATLVERFWIGTGRWVLRRYALVALGCLAIMAAVGMGLKKTETSVQLLKLFDKDAKIIQDYRWLEANFGKLVPMELVVRIHPEMLKPSIDELAVADETTEREALFQLNMLERMELAARVQYWVEQVFGEDGEGVVGRGISAATFAPELPPPGAPSLSGVRRGGFNMKLEQSRERILAADYLRIDRDRQHLGSELWRISLRLGALNDVDYGDFVHRQKLVVEPLLAAYRYRTDVLRKIAENGKVKLPRVGIICRNPAIAGVEADRSEEVAADSTNGADPGVASTEPSRGTKIDQTRMFASTLRDVLKSAGCMPGFTHPDDLPEEAPEGYFTTQLFANQLDSLQCVVLLEDHPEIDVDFLRENSPLFIDARDHTFQLGAGTQTAAERNDPVQVVYTGVVPVVYKAQRTLLNSLVNSIGLAFVMIAAVMMVLLRDWRAPLGVTNTLNVSGGMLSMIPNVFPVVLIFGAMGHLGIKIDIGTMMCASVAMGVAVDDTIHFLTWFRHGIREGLQRHDAILEAYRRVGTAMTQTTLIGGLGLAVFALSTFTPTQRFGMMMVTLLATALVGDLVLLPALLASPLGRCFCPRSVAAAVAPQPAGADATLADPASHTEAATPHTRTRRDDKSTIRTDPQH